MDKWMDDAIWLMDRSNKFSLLQRLKDKAYLAILNLRPAQHSEA